MNKLSPLSWWRNVPQEKHASNDPFFSLHQSIDRLFEDFENQFRFPTTRFGDFGASPRIDVS